MLHSVYKIVRERIVKVATIFESTKKSFISLSSYGVQYIELKSKLIFLLSFLTNNECVELIYDCE